MGKYHCSLCELSHHELKDGSSCPECGRRYCLDSIKESVEAGKTDCPYCDTPYEMFSDIPIPSYSFKPSIWKIWFPNQWSA